MGQLIIFEGLDGSGKGTQTKLTAQRLKEQGRELRQITFPDYESESSALVKMYLSGAFGDKPDDVNAYAASSFYAVDRFASYKTDWGEFYREGGLVLSPLPAGQPADGRRGLPVMFPAPQPPQTPNQLPQQQKQHNNADDIKNLQHDFSL